MAKVLHQLRKIFAPIKHYNKILSKKLSKKLIWNFGTVLEYNELSMLFRVKNHYISNHALVALWLFLPIGTDSIDTHRCGGILFSEVQ